MYYEIERHTRVKEQLKANDVDIDKMFTDGYKKHFNLLADAINLVMMNMEKEGK